MTDPITRHRTHPLTPFISAIRSLGFLLAALALAGGGPIVEVANNIGWLLGVLIFLMGAAVLVSLIGAMYWLSWSRTEYFFDEAGDFRLDSGVVQRQERRIALSRLQSVDVMRPLIGRVVGLAQLRIEVAGTGDSRVVLSYLSDTTARSLRAEIVARAAGVDPEAGEAPEEVLAVVPTKDLALSLLLRSETFFMLGVSVLVVAVAIGTDGWGSMGLLLVTGGVPILSVFSQFMRFFGFTVAESPDGLRLRYGLTSVQSQTVPPGRVQAIELAEPLLWRRRGWVSVRLNVAGLQDSSDKGQVDQVLLPVAPRPVAEAIIARVLPGVDFPNLTFDRVPQRARRRSWLQWRSLGVAVQEHVFVSRRGFLTRQTAVIPHARTQSVGVTQGPWQRALGLATVRIDTTPGPVSVLGLHRDARDARAIAQAQILRAGEALRSNPPERWMAPPNDGIPHE